MSKSYTVVNCYACAYCPGREFWGNLAWNSHWMAHERQFEKTGNYGPIAAKRKSRSHMDSSIAT